MSSASRMEIRGHALTLEGDISTYGLERRQSISNALKAPGANIDELRCYNLNFDVFSQSMLDWLCHDVLLQTWNLVILALCQGRFLAAESADANDTVLPRIPQTILRARRLEVYGTQMEGMLNAIGKTLLEPACCLEVLRLRSRLQDNEDLQGLTDALASPLCKLQALHVTCEFLDETSMQRLADALGANQHLQTLAFYSCEFVNDVETCRLLEAITNHPTLSTLEWKDNNCLGMTALARLVQHSQTLKQLAIFHPHQRIEHAPEGTLHDDNMLPVTVTTQLDIQALSNALQDNTSLVSLQLSNNGLEVQAARHLASALTINTTLETLDLQTNILSDNAVKALAQALPNMQALRQLYLWNNPFGTQGARALAEGLSRNEILTDITTFSQFRNSEEIQYYTHLNKTTGRKLLGGGGTSRSPMGVWPLLVERINTQSSWEDKNKASVLYTLLKEGAGALFLSSYY